VAMRRLETMDLDGLRIQLQTLLLIDQELLYILALVALELDHLAHLRVVDDGAIAGELLLDHLEDLLLVELLREPLHRRQCLATIAFCASHVSLGVERMFQSYWRVELTLDTDVDVVLRLLGVSSGISIGLCKGVYVTCQSAVFTMTLF
jgi:hypothetical protein